MARPTRVKPKKPQGFPLFPHASGTWAKKINGKHVHFGPWHDRDRALQAYHDYLRTARYGRAPAPRPDGTITVKELRNHFLTRQHGRLKAGEIAPRTFRSMLEVIPRFEKAMGEDTIVADLGPTDFQHYRNTLATLGQHATNRHVRVVRQMFRWAYDTLAIQAIPRYGDSMAFVSQKARVRRGEKTAKQLFTAEEIRTLIAGAKQPLKSMILLGINCGFGNTDCSELTFDDLDLEAGIIDNHRRKTVVIPRRCILWKETVESLREAIAQRKRPESDADEDLVFITRYRRRFVREAQQEKGGVVQHVAVADAVAQVFGRLMEATGLWKRKPPTHEHPNGTVERDGRSFYALRHTFCTWADETREPNAVARIMGHQIEGIKVHYVEEVKDYRLKIVSDHVHSILFARASRARKAPVKSITSTNGR